MSRFSHTTHGAFFFAGAQLFRYSLSFAVLPILTRLLSIEDFGIVAMVLPIVLVVNLIGDAGIPAALIRAEKVTIEQWASGFWANVVMSGTLAVALYLLATPVTALYREPRVNQVLHALSAVVALNCAIGVPYARLMREFRFRFVALTETAAAFLGSICAIFSAVLGASYWSLVLQVLVIQLFKAVMLSIGSGGYHFRGASIAQARNLLVFGVHYSVATVLNVLTRNLDKALLGRFLGAHALGAYGLASQMSFTPADIMIWGPAKVLTSTFAQIQSDSPKLQHAVQRNSHFFAAIVLPLVVGGSAISSPLFSVVFGAKWKQSAEIFAILASTGAALAMRAPFEAAIIAVGRVDLNVKLSICTLVIVTAGFFLGVTHGATGVALGVVLSFWCSFVLTMVVSVRVLNQSLAPYFGSIIRVGVPTIAMGVVAHLLCSAGSKAGWSNFLQVIVAIPVSAAVYIGLLAWMDIETLTLLRRSGKDY